MTGGEPQARHAEAVPVLVAAGHVVAAEILGLLLSPAIGEVVPEDAEGLEEVATHVDPWWQLAQPYDLKARYPSASSVESASASPRRKRSKREPSDVSERSNSAMASVTESGATPSAYEAAKRRT